MSSPAEETRYKRSLIINAAILFLLGVSLSIILLFLPAEDYFHYYLNQSQKSLELRNYSSLEVQLKKAARYAKTKDQWFSLFKRAYIAAGDMDDYEYFYSLVTTSRKFIKAGPDHEALNTAVLLWTNQYEKAAASLYAIQNDKYKTLIAESLLSYDVYRNYDLEDKTPLEFIKEKIQYQEDPEFFESVGTKADNADLLYNAALLSMENEDYDRAISILGRLSGNRINPYLLSVLYYDLGNYEKAYDALKAQSVLDDMKGTQRFSIHEQMGDIAFRSGNMDTALNHYLTAVSLNRQGSWKNYRNIARLYLDRGYSAKSKAVLKEGMILFPDNINLLNDFVAFFKIDSPVESRKILTQFTSRHPGLSQAELLKIRYFPDPKSSVQYQAEIWELFNKDVSNDEVTRFLLWYLSGIGDTDSMQIVLQRYTPADDYPFWYYFHQSVIEVQNGNFDEAVMLMDKAYSLNSQWYISYNHGILDYCRGNWVAADQFLQDAEENLSMKSSILGKNSYLSRIKFNRAQILSDHEEFEKALPLLEEAVELDKQNLRAATLLNRIK